MGLATYLKCFMSNMANVSQIRQFSSCEDGNFLLMSDGNKVHREHH